MAFQNDGYALTIVMGAKNDKTRTLNFELTSTSYADAVTDTAAILTVLAGVSAGVVKSYTVHARAVEDAYNRPTDDDAEWRDTAIVVAEIAGNPTKKATFKIPMPRIGIFAAAAGENMDVVDIADAALLSYKAIFEVGGEATISDGESITNLLRGQRVS